MDNVGIFLCSAVFACAVLLTSCGVLSVQVSFAAAVMVLLVTRFITLQPAFQAVDRPVIILLGAMIPFGGALETIGGATRISAAFAELGDFMPPWARTSSS